MLPGYSGIEWLGGLYSFRCYPRDDACRLCGKSREYRKDCCRLVDSDLGHPLFARWKVGDCGAPTAPARVCVSGKERPAGVNRRAKVSVARNLGSGGVSPCWMIGIRNAQLQIGHRDFCRVLAAADRIQFGFVEFALIKVFNVLVRLVHCRSPLLWRSTPLMCGDHAKRGSGPL